ncbi:MAG: outer membrane lipoprotein-sorting protein [Pseudomonadota bacterium]
MKTWFASLAMASPILFSGALAAQAPAADAVVAAADAVRNPPMPFERKLTLVEYVDGAPHSKTVLRVYSKIDPATSQFRNLVRYEDPPRDIAKAVLMNGVAMWFYDPAARSSVRISPQQRLLGQAAQGDVVTVNLARDYHAKLVGPDEGETLTDADHQARKCWHVELAPRDDGAIYGKVDYWVEQGSNHPVKAKFYSDSGRLLKIAYYHKYDDRLGAQRPTEIILIDAVNAKLVTTMVVSEDKAREVPDSWYQRDYLPRVGQ